MLLLYATHATERVGVGEEEGKKGRGWRGFLESKITMTVFQKTN